MINNMGLNKAGSTAKKIFGENNQVVTIQVEKGYPKIRLPNHGRNTFVHHTAYMYYNQSRRNDPAFRQAWLDPSMDISHRCGKPRCMSLSCLVLESHDFNVTRDYCHGLNSGIGCPHNPPCKHRTL
jgi:hypothetical protein